MIFSGRRQMRSWLFRTGDHSGKDLTDEELAEFQTQLLEQGREEAKKLPDRLHPAKPPPCPITLPPPPKQAAHHLPNPLQLQLVRVDPLQPYNCREPPQRFSSLAQALQLTTKLSVNPVVVHAAAALHARGAEILHRRKWESLDAAVFWVVLKECHAKPTNKQYADALLKATRNKVCASTISSGAKMLSDDSAFVSALKSELSRLTQKPKSTAKEISSSPATVSKPGPMPSSNRTKRSREDDPADLSRESAHMGPHVTSAGQEATNLSSAADVESLRPVKKKMCFGVGQPSSGAVSQVGDSSKHAGDYTTICGDLANDAAVTAGVPVNPISGDYICFTLHSSSVLLGFLLHPCLAWLNCMFLDRGSACKNLQSSCTSVSDLHMLSSAHSLCLSVCLSLSVAFIHFCAAKSLQTTEAAFTFILALIHDLLTSFLQPTPC